MEFSNRVTLIGLDLWGRAGVAPGWRYRVTERAGPRLAASPLLGKLPNGCTVDCDIADHVQRHIFFWGVYEPVEAYIFSKMVKPGYVVIDAGANVGQYTMLASTAVGRTGHVHAFEPIPGNLTRLNRNIAANQLTNVSVHPIALWNESTELDFGQAAEPVGENHGSYGFGRHSASSHLRVPAGRLDDYVRASGVERCDVIKMDIEGSEAAALEGASETLSRFSPLILLELNRDAAFAAGSSVERVFELLSSRGYTLWRISIDGLVPLTNVRAIAQDNVVASGGPLPAELKKIPPLKSILRWARTVRRSGVK